MGGSSRRSPAGAQRQRDRGHGDAEAEKIGGRKRGLMLENDLRARGPAGQVLLRSTRVKALTRACPTLEMSVILPSLDQ